ncbi:mycofactocin-coupled SDR family oxidoreductase [Rhodococcus sp. NCIMB 12038]|uniref:mycofactocin-coupled SDR family oxidoreductase n=1 Tax=Rhodococcus sp. NCIMB 12038 TaxID=933800 RepID=UPI000B3C5680|nr:mycofactocin-coupled SDR family oxidoreductase [Rhodococcus sp. NCIMB 12038]OUS92210.1 3-ketoacyl-ACP reductase [Rhodococcus sp. NCIMB 12038]
MTGRLEGKVAFITGAARGQGRSHALTLAQEGADIIAVDLLENVDSVPYALSSQEDMDETVRLVESAGRKIYSAKADVRDANALNAAVNEGVSQFGRLDIVLANAGIASVAPIEDLSVEKWRDMIDINLTGVFNTVKAALPHLTAHGQGGSIVITSSTAGIKGLQNLTHYDAAKHGVVGFMKGLANELAPRSIRVNTVHPTSVDNDMANNETFYGLMVPGKAPAEVTREEALPVYQSINALPVPLIDARDVSNAILFLVSEDARYITGIQLPVDAGATTK